MIIPTKITVLKPDGTRTEQTLDLPKNPSLEKLHELVDPHLGTAMFEHVSVLYEDKPCDMFVDEMGHQKGLPRNEEGTKIYRTYWLKHHKVDPESMSWIAGIVVLFHRRVWF